MLYGQVKFISYAGSDAYTSARQKLSILHIGLPNIANVTTTMHDRKALLTWDALSIDDVDYCIDVFCDNEKIGTHQTRYTQFQQSTEDGKEYSLHIWAKKGARRSDKAVDYIVKGQVFVPDASNEVLLAGCKLLYDRSTLRRESKVQLSMKLSERPGPEGFIPICHVFNIDTERKFCCEGKVQVQTAFVNLSVTDVSVLHFSDASLSQCSIANPDVCTDGLVEFQVADFSPFLVAIKRLLFGDQLFRCGMRLYALPHHQFRLAFYLIDGETEKRVESSYRALGARLAQRYNPVIVKPGDEIFGRLSVKQRGPNFTPCECWFFVDEEFAQKSHQDHAIMLQQYPREEPQIVIETTIKKNMEVIDDTHDFRYPLGPERRPAVNIEEFRNFHITENISAQTVFKDEAHGTVRHHRPRGGAGDRRWCSVS